MSVVGAQFHIAAVFALAGAFLLCYRLFRPNCRPSVTLTFALLCGLACLSFGSSALGAHTSSNRAQVVAWAPIGLAVCFGWSVVSLKQARSLESPGIGARTRALLRACPLILGTAFVLNFSLGLLWPVPVMEFYSNAPLRYLPYKLVILLPEAFSVGVSAYAFFKAAGFAATIGRIRLQNLFFFLGSSFLTLITLEASADAFVRVFAEPAARAQWEAVVIVVELALTILFAICFVVGVLLYYSRGEGARVTTRFSRWRRHREVLDRKLWSVAASGCEGHAQALGHLSAAADELRRRAEDDAREGLKPGWLEGDTQRAIDTFRLLVLLESNKRLSDGTTTRETIFALVRFHNYLLNNPKTSNLGWDIVGENAKPRSYSLRSDPLYEPLAKIPLLITGDKHPKLQLVSEPQWLQLAAVIAASSGLLSETRARRILFGDAVKHRVLTAYENAKLKAQIPYPLSASGYGM